MKNGKNAASLAHHLSKFEGVYSSGLFVPDPAITTALALIFERVHFLNNEEFILQFARESRITIPKSEKIDCSGFTIENDAFVRDQNPYPDLKPEQKRRAFFYDNLAADFFKRYASLSRDIFKSQYIEPNKTVTLILEDKEGKERARVHGSRPGQIKIIARGGLEEDFNNLIAEGKIPILARIIPYRSGPVDSIYATSERAINSSTQLASALALQSVAMVLPSTCDADAETILEARHKLRDHLPPFWSSMLKLSVELNDRLSESAGFEERQRECDYAVSTTVRPALIDLVDKLEKERKQWFYRILSPFAKGLSVLAGKPPVGMVDLISASLKLGANVAIDVSDQIRKVNALKSETGLAYLLELHKQLPSRLHRC